LKIRDLEKIGEIITRTTEKGANQIGNINFTIDDEYELKNQIAIEKAKEKAQLIAEQSGMKLGKIKGMHENSYQLTDKNSYGNARMEMQADGSDEFISPSIETGQNEIKAEVTLIYEVR